MRKIYIKTALLSFLTMFSIWLSPALVSASCDAPATTQEALQCGSSNSAGVPVSTAPSGTINSTVANVVNILSIFVGIVAVIVIVVGGFRYVTSNGKQESVQGAKNTIMYAVIGLIIAALAQVIARFVLRKVTK